MNDKEILAGTQVSYFSACMKFIQKSYVYFNMFKGQWKGWGDDTNIQILFLLNYSPLLYADHYQQKKMKTSTRIFFCSTNYCQLPTAWDMSSLTVPRIMCNAMHRTGSLYSLEQTKLRLVWSWKISAFLICTLCWGLFMILALLRTFPWLKLSWMGSSWKSWTLQSLSASLLAQIDKQLVNSSWRITLVLIPFGRWYSTEIVSIYKSSFC